MSNRTFFGPPISTQGWTHAGVTNWKGIPVKGWVDPSDLEPVTTVDPDETTADPDSPATASVQWKGTNVCLDFYCPCGMQSHFDGYHAHALECGACGAVFDMPQAFAVLPREARA